MMNGGERRGDPPKNARYLYQQYSGPQTCQKREKEEKEF